MEPTPRRWAVTGATGLVGNNLVRALLARGHEVTVLARGAGRKELADLPIRVEVGDLDDPAALRRCFQGVDVVAHVAALVWIGYSQKDDMARINVEGTRRVCEAVPDGARLLHVSTVDAIGWGTLAAPATEDVPRRPSERGVPYGDTKEAGDAVVRASGRDYVIVRPSFMVGPWDWKPSSGKMVLEVARGRVPLAPPGTNNYVDVRDVCAGILTAAERAPSGREYILGGENLSYLDFWTLVAQVTCGPAPRGELPRWLGPVAVAAMGLPRLLGMKEGEINAATTRFGFTDHAFDPSRARAELDLPQTPLRQAVADAWAWFGAHGYV